VLWMEKYISVLDENLWPVILRHFADNNYIFQDDNAPVHRARIVQDFGRNNQLKSMNWPAQSPDLNIIENCWWRLKRELQKRAANISNVHELRHAIRDIWTYTPIDYIQNLYKSIPRRILRVIRNKGNITKY
jgi:hypothetical protein